MKYDPETETAVVTVPVIFKRSDTLRPDWDRIRTELVFNASLCIDNLIDTALEEMEETI